MIKLESNFKYGTNITRYFKTLEDCNKYLYVFKDHWCGVPWKEPIEVNNSANIKTTELVTNPIKVANSDLSWGFNNCDLNNISETTKQEIQYFISKMVKELAQ